MKPKAKPKPPAGGRCLLPGCPEPPAPNRAAQGYCPAHHAEVLEIRRLMNEMLHDDTRKPGGRWRAMKRRREYSREVHPDPRRGRS